MRIAIPVISPDTASEISLRFARSPYFALVDTQSRKTEYLKNPYHDMKMKAGKRLFELLVAEHHADTFLAFELGLKVQQLAVARKIQLIINNKRQTLAEILDLVKHVKKTDE